MPKTSADLAPDAVKDIQRLVSRELDQSGVREPDIVVVSGEDHDGDPAIIVKVKYRQKTEPFDARAAARALFKLNSMLSGKGEHRFAYIVHSDEDEP